MIKQTLWWRVTLSLFRILFAYIVCVCVCMNYSIVRVRIINNTSIKKFVLEPSKLYKLFLENIMLDVIFSLKLAETITKIEDWCLIVKGRLASKIGQNLDPPLYLRSIVMQIVIEETTPPKLLYNLYQLPLNIEYVVVIIHGIFSLITYYTKSFVVRLPFYSRIYV